MALNGIAVLGNKQWSGSGERSPHNDFVYQAKPKRGRNSTKVDLTHQYACLVQCYKVFT